MSKINRIRIVNLNYNNNSMKVDDEIFSLKGDNTMLNLRNGGGKSVLVQMMIAPFVHKRYRDMKDRKFESYFTSRTPTYILVEWKLDDGGGYVLTGMMARKKEVTSDENSKAKLDMVNFIYEYKEKNEFDIKKIPVVDDKSGRRAIKSFANSKKLFEDLKKNRDIKFNYYDMNNSVTSKNYFEKLMEFKINHSEWESIIKRINLKESGLSELFVKAKDSNGLMKEWFLPAVEDKLKVEEDRIKNYRELTQRYVKQYRENESSIHKKRKIERFINLSQGLKVGCEEFINTIDRRDAKENEIANVLRLLKKNLREREIEELGLEESMRKMEEKLQELKYEKESIKIHEKKDEIERFENEKKKLEYDKKESEDRRKNLDRKCKTIECAKSHREYQESSRELQLCERELEAVSQKNKDNAPRINDLGFTMRGILERELTETEEKRARKKEALNELACKKEESQENLKNYREESTKLSVVKGELTAEVNHFYNVEEKILKNYGFVLQRNIQGEYDKEELIREEKQLVDDSLNQDKNRKIVGEKVLNSREILNSLDSEKEKILIQKTSEENELRNKRESYLRQEAEVQERKEIIKYVDFHEDKVFHKEEILYAFNRKIDILRNEHAVLSRNCETVEKEIEKLKSGKVMELSSDVEEKLRERGITVIYGMEWLNNNGYSVEKNGEIVRKNPFIPYSLVMDSNEIEILQKEAIEIFTSNPIAIINRKDMEKIIEDKKGEIIDLGGIKFYISFNHKLLDEEERVRLINDKIALENDIREEIVKKKEAIDFYEDKRNKIQYSSLTEERYKDLALEINDLQEMLTVLRERELEIEKKRIDVKNDISDLEKGLKIIDEKIKLNIEKQKFFRELKSEYEKYIKSREKLQYTQEKLNILMVEIEKEEKRGKEIIEEINSALDGEREYAQAVQGIHGEIVQFKQFREGNIVSRDREDILAEFKALTKEITKSEKELKEKQIELNTKFKNAEHTLNFKSDEYGVLEEEYINESYDIRKELDYKKRLEDEREHSSSINIVLGECEKKIAVINSKLEELQKGIKERFNKDEPKAREDLIDKDFKTEMGVIKVNMKEKKESIKKLKKLQSKLSQNITNLSEYNHLEIIEEMDVELILSDLNSQIGKLKRDLNNIKEEIMLKERKLESDILEISAIDDFKEESLFKDPIETLKKMIPTPVEFKKQLEMVVDSYVMIVEKLMTDIEFIQKEEGKLLESLLEYIKDVHINIEKIDDNSTITIKNRRLKMLNIKVTDWDENKEIYSIRLKEFVESIRNQCLESLRKNEDIEDIISNRMNIHKLYDEIVGIGTVIIKLYKIEEDKQRQITWNQVAQNSGGEGFLSAFVILSSLLSYMRKDESQLFSNRESGKVLVMDNPFAQTSSSHLLKPLIDIAEKSNTQLICLTGLGGDSIYNRFDNIYVLNLVSSKLNQGIKYLKGEHTKGDEEPDEKEIMVSSRLMIEEQRLF